MYSILLAQERDTSKIDFKFTSSDTVFIQDSLKRMSADEMMVSSAELNKQFELTKSPTMAIVYSLIAPGAGQLYVESYWKAPFIAAAAGYFIYYAIDNHSKFKDNENNPNTAIKEFYRNNRDRGLFFLAGVYIVASVDAYVGAHLYDFTVSEDLSLNIYPSTERGLCIALSYKW